MRPAFPSAVAASTEEDIDDFCCQEEVKYVSYEQKGTVFRIPKRYKIQQTLGNGAFGVVVAAKDETNDEIVTIKKVPNVFENGIEFAKRMLREIKVLKHFRNHENIILLKDVVKPSSFEDFNDVYLVTEYCDETLRNFISQDVEFSDQHIQFIIYQLLRSIKYIHSANVLHRDIKPQNILINCDCKTKICDFGMSKSIENEKEMMSSHYVSTRWYRAPELLLSCKEANKAIDIWSIGCVFAELLGATASPKSKASKTLFPGKDLMHMLDLILNVTGTPIISELNCNNSAKMFLRSRPVRQPADLQQMFPKANLRALDLLAKMLVFNPDKRITAEEALMHDYFENIHDTEEEYVCDEKLNCFIKEDVTLDELKQLIYDELMNFDPDEEADQTDLEDFNEM